MIVTNPHGWVTFINPAGRALLSYSGPLPASPELLPSALSKLLASARNSAKGGVNETCLSLDGNGDHAATAEAHPFPFGEGQTGVLMILRGVRESNPYETKIRHFERLARLGVLSAGLAHELRNAMVALSTMTDLLIEQQDDNDLARTVRRELDRANSLAARMLKYARPHPRSRKPVSTHEVLDRALQLANSRFKETGATVTKSLQADPDVISADEAHLEQMFLNLLINAADAMPQNGEVTLSTDLIREQTLGHAVRIAVKDTGTGIAPDLLPNLFEPFFTTKRHGTGLGLYLAQRIIDEHSGTINVNSVPGQGTCVQVLLPVHQA